MPRSNEPHLFNAGQEARSFDAVLDPFIPGPDETCLLVELEDWERADEEHDVARVFLKQHEYLRQ